MFTAREAIAPSPGPRHAGARVFEELRRTEYARLDAGGHSYLDYTGAALYGASQVAGHTRRLREGVFGNPHSENPAAQASTGAMERARGRVLAFFGADPDRYEVVFTANATAAVQRVAEAFPFRRGSSLVLTADNHNSINGIACFAARAGARVAVVPLEPSLRSLDPAPWLDSAPGGHPHLFAFPAQSNFSGVRHPLEWVERAESRGFRVLLDGAAFVPTHPLRLDRVAPSFLCISFYKMFGLPTGLGALIARRDALEELQRPWFSGGTVEWGSPAGVGGHLLRPGATAFEDGTPHFLAFDDLCQGLDLLEGIGMEAIAARTQEMTALLLAGLRGLRHRNGAPMVRLHGPETTEERGGTVPFSLLSPGAEVIPFEEVVSRAAARGVSVRGGCFCNPGCAGAALTLSDADAARCREALGSGFTPARFADCVGAPVGAVRASVGIPTIASDIERLLAVLAEGWVTPTRNPRPHPSALLGK